MSHATSRSLLIRVFESLGWWQALGTKGPTRVLAVNSLVDAMGTGVAGVCLPFFALTVAHLSLQQFALAMSLGGISEIATTVPAGLVASRFGMRGYSIGTRVGRAGLYCLLACEKGFLPVAIVLMLIGVLRAASGGIFQAYSTAVAGAKNRTHTLAVVRSLQNVGFLLGSGMAALILVMGRPGLLQVALAVNGASFLVSAVCTAMVRPAEAVRTGNSWDLSVLRDLRYFALMVTSTVFGTSLTILTVGLPLWVLRFPSLPKAVVATVVIMNTLLVIVFQYRFSHQSDSTRGALHALRRASACLAATAVLIALSGSLRTGWGVVAILASGVVLTIGEMCESPAWWTISSAMAPPESRTQYLATFSLNEGLLNTVGPMAMAMVVSAGRLGWGVYALLTLAAAGSAQLLVGGRALGADTASTTAASTS